MDNDPYWNPPNHELYWEIRSDKADMAVQRNVLLHFLVENNLANDALVWLKTNMPDVFRKHDEE